MRKMMQQTNRKSFVGCIFCSAIIPLHNEKHIKAKLCNGKGQSFGYFIYFCKRK